MEVTPPGPNKDLAGDLVCEILPCMLVGALFAWVAAKALTRCYVSEMVIVKGFFGIVFVGFSIGALAMSYILLIALIDFIKEAVRKDP